MITLYQLFFQNMVSLQQEKDSYEIWSYQVAYAGQGRADQVRDRLDGRLNEFKVSEGEDLLNCNLSILVLVGSLNKVLQQVAHQCQLLSEQ